MSKFQIFLLAVFFLIIGSPVGRMMLPFNLGAHAQPLCGFLSAFFFLWLSILAYFEKYGEASVKISLFSVVLALALTLLFVIYKFRGGWFFGGRLPVHKYYVLIFLLIDTLIFYMATREDCKECKMENNRFVDLLTNNYFSNKLSARKIVILAGIILHVFVQFFAGTYSTVYLQFLLAGWSLGVNIYLLQRFYENRISQ